MARRDPPPDESATTFRIGEVAKLAGVTTRTLRYWEELGLLRPESYRGHGERRYTQADMTRVSRIRELQELLGFSLAEVRVVLDTEDVDVLDRVISEYRRGGVGLARRLALIEEAIEANDKLLARLDSTLARIGAFRDERAQKAVRLRARRDELEAEMGAIERPPDRATGSGRASPPRTAPPERGRTDRGRKAPAPRVAGSRSGRRNGRRAEGRPVEGAKRP